MVKYVFFVLCLVLSSCAVKSDEIKKEEVKWTGWEKLSDPNYFPIAVWLQSPKNASKYKEIGINLYVGLWKGPTKEQIEELEKHNMPVICGMNEFGLEYVKNKGKNSIIVGWMHQDEPDNAQPLPDKSGYGPPIPPEKIIKYYEELKQKDPTRPILLNLGQGVAWDGWVGRGVRTNHPEDYPEYIKGCDIVSFDIYPVAHPRNEIQGKLWYVGYGVERLVKWSEGRKIVWNCLECTNISSDKKANPYQIRTEAWMSIINGSRGFIWFVHIFKPKFIEAGILAEENRENMEAVKNVNKEVTELAPIINSPDLKGLKITTDSNIVVKGVLKKYKNEYYIFAVSIGENPTQAKFELPEDLKLKKEVEVMKENRSIRIVDNYFTDKFEGYQVHLYKIK
ncbi:MAG: hypothetical protein NC827_07630 [Candidatus Omnitrophica bacterium]|nr:hypothetical protein [Candidatus Omnitrophota bacterium]